MSGDQSSDHESSGEARSLSANTTAGALERSDESFDALLREIAAGGPPPPLLPKPGDVIAGKYRIEARLGQGGMGVVFRATHTISGKQVAIKWMLNASASEHGRSRFVREARAAARIDHENVVDVYDIGQDGDRGLYLVMQLLRGESLAARLERGRIEDIGEAVDLLLPAMRGVAAVHAAGVIHRDLKPDNIFLCEATTTTPRTSKVLDFGISAVSEPESVQDNTLTREGTFLGTPAYVSPEQVEDIRGVDGRSDVYAFGVLLYECLTGGVPFRAQTQHALVHAIVSGVYKEPRVVRPELPAELNKVVVRAMANKREARFASVEALIDALRPFSGEQGYVSLPPRPARRRVGPLLALGALGSLALGAVWLRASEPTPQRVVHTTPTAPAKEVAPPPVTNERAPAPPAREEAVSAPVSPTVVSDAGVARPLTRPKRAAAKGIAPPSEVHANPGRPRSGSIAIEEL